MMLCYLLYFFVSCVAGHSWIACTDVDVANKYELPRGPAETDPARRVYDPSKCRGYPRAWNKYPKDFGRDGKYNHLISNGKLCKQPKEYTDRYYKATYTGGDRICLQYPSKNHVASPTTDIFMPDGGMRIFRSNTPSVNPTTLDDMVQLQHSNGVHQKGTIDYKGFSNCPNFDANNDKATCTVCFDVDKPAEGEYTFIWLWKFGPGAEYSTCWEANVINGAASVPDIPSETPTPDTCVVYYHQCGGKQLKGSKPCCDPDQKCVYKEPFWSSCHWKDDTKNCVEHNEQCGGQYYQGPTRCCNTKQTCVKKNRYKSRCM